MLPYTNVTCNHTPVTAFRTKTPNVYVYAQFSLWRCSYIVYGHSLEIAREEEERLKREEILKQATMSRHIVQKLESLEANQDKIKHQQEEMSKVMAYIIDSCVPCCKFMHANCDLFECKLCTHSYYKICLPSSYDTETKFLSTALWCFIWSTKQSENKGKLHYQWTWPLRSKES